MFKFFWHAYTEIKNDGVRLFQFCYRSIYIKTKQSELILELNSKVGSAFTNRLICVVYLRSVCANLISNCAHVILNLEFKTM